MSHKIPYGIRISTSVWIDPETECWVWQGFLDEDGYPGKTVSLSGKIQTAHRSSYESFVGEIPNGFHIDHLCRNRACVNPEHLEPVSVQENIKRGKKGVLNTHCHKGHILSPENTWRHSLKHPKWRKCRECGLQGFKEYYQRNKHKTKP